jgi:hypothetical protein
MAKGTGVDIPDHTKNRIQVARGETGGGRVMTTRADTNRARSYIDKELAQGRPVVTGISFVDSNYNRDKITDHFVLLTGRGVDRSGHTYYTMADPIGNDAKQGTSRRLYVDSATGNLFGSGLLGHYEMSMVVPSSR